MTEFRRRSVVLCAQLHQDGISALRETCDVETIDGVEWGRIPAGALLNADALILGEDVHLSAEHLGAAPRLQLICCVDAASSCIDLRAVMDRSIGVLPRSDCHATASAERDGALCLASKIAREFSVPRIISGAGALRLQAARLRDASLLLAWVNHPDSLANKLKTRSEISAEGHIVWLAATLQERRTRLWIMYLEQRPAGQIRLQPDDDGTIDIDIFTLPDHRGRGLGSAALELAMRDYLDAFPGSEFRARVRLENGASRALFRHLEFEPMEISQESVTLIRSGRRRKGNSK